MSYKGSTWLRAGDVGFLGKKGAFTRVSESCLYDFGALGVSGSGCGVACGLRTLFCLTVPVQSLGWIRSFGFVAVVARPTSK